MALGLTGEASGREGGGAKSGNSSSSESSSKAPFFFFAGAFPLLVEVAFPFPFRADVGSSSSSSPSASSEPEPDSALASFFELLPDLAGAGSSSSSCSTIGSEVADAALGPLAATEQAFLEFPRRPEGTREVGAVDRLVLGARLPPRLGLFSISSSSSSSIFTSSSLLSIEGLAFFTGGADSTCSSSSSSDSATSAKVTLLRADRLPEGAGVALARDDGARRDLVGFVSLSSFVSGTADWPRFLLLGCVSTDGGSADTLGAREVLRGGMVCVRRQRRSVTHQRRARHRHA